MIITQSIYRVSLNSRLRFTQHYRLYRDNFGNRDLSNVVFLSILCICIALEPSSQLCLGQTFSISTFQEYDLENNKAYSLFIRCELWDLFICQRVKDNLVKGFVWWRRVRKLIRKVGGIFWTWRKKIFILENFSFPFYFPKIQKNTKNTFFFLSFLLFYFIPKYFDLTLSKLTLKIMAFPMNGWDHDEGK